MPRTVYWQTVRGRRGLPLVAASTFEGEWRSVVAESTDNRGLKLVRSPHFWAVLGLLCLCLVLHYPQQLLGVSSPSIFSFMGLSRHAAERILLLVPVSYAGFVFGTKGGVLCLSAAMGIMVPRAFFLSQYLPDALFETIGVIVVGVFINLWIRSYRKERERRHVMLSELKAAHEELRTRAADLETSERKYKDILENACDAIWEQDLDGRITNTNQAGQSMCGYTKQELVGMNVISFLPEDSLSLAVRIRSSLFSGKPIAQPYEQRLIRRNGAVAVVQMATSLIMEAGSPSGFLHIARDVTARHQVENVLDTVEEGIAVIGRDLVIEFVNPSLKKEFGEGKGENCFRLLYGRSQQCDGCPISEVILGSTEQRESTFSNGNTFRIAYRPFTGLDLRPCVVATFANVTRRKRYEAELVKVNEVHSRLLTEKVEQLKQVSLEVARLEHQKGEFIHFLGVVAHDLKSPLSVSYSILSGVMQGYYGGLGQGQRDMIDRVTRRIDDLNALIDDLIDIPLIESGNLVREMSDVDLREVVQRSVDDLMTLAADKGLQLGLALPARLPAVSGSGRRLRR